MIRINQILKEIEDVDSEIVSCMNYDSNLLKNISSTDLIALLGWSVMFIEAIRKELRMRL